MTEENKQKKKNVLEQIKAYDDLLLDTKYVYYIQAVPFSKFRRYDFLSMPAA